MSLRSIFIRIGLPALMFLSANPLHADSFESLFMPGPVIEGHAKIEQDCKKCHSRFSKAQQNDLCLACHDKVAADIKAARGFHGISNAAKTQPCKQCHHEHLGRTADVVNFDRETFNHRNSDFTLQGKHNQVQCAQCHKPKKKWRDAPQGCYDCHQKDDVHKGQLSKECRQCHNETRWGEAKFDHDKTEFKLQGKHEKVDCESCHPGNRFKKTPKNCFSCHSIDDKHRGLFDRKCERCHVDKDWKTITFNHDRHTKYRLQGRHRDITCQSCHPQNAYRVKLKNDCYSCHKADDFHKGKFSQKCEKCHNEKNWRKDNFDHDRDTKFPLKAKHKDARCADCHAGGIAQKRENPRICFDCHQSEDVHKGKQGKLCNRCHGEADWRQKVVFDHDTTNFPLIGLHAAVPCESCHLNTAYEKVKSACADCHSADDVHHGSLTGRCTTCHNPNGWNFWVFNHDKQTEYTLRGKHNNLACKACHNSPVKIKIRMSKECISCHRADDTHRGRYGNQCDRCHSVDDFKNIQLSR